MSTPLNTVTLTPPYLLFIGNVSSKAFAKTALGLVQFCPEHVKGQWRFDQNPLDLGVPDMNLEQALAAGVKTVIIGVAPIGGSIDPEWLSCLAQAARQGLHIVSGLHSRLQTFPELVAAAKVGGGRLIDIRLPPPNLPIGNGEKRPGKRVLMVGTDCAVGKKYTALALSKSLQAMGQKASFRATGQTGIMIAGRGLPIDAVVADFISGAAESVSPANEPDHWDVIEGQGSLFNPSYAGVSLGLLHGAQPDALVLCHDATRKVVNGLPHIPLPDLNDCIELHLRCGRLTNPNIRCVGISVNTSGLAPGEREPYLQQLSAHTGHLCIDSLIDSADAIAAKLIADYA